jgi:4-amino-4-deoxy-L-arabinose transferase-like glycosyltransferase
MSNLIRLLQQLSTGQFAFIIVLLCIPAFFIHLGSVAFIGDEAIRALVAFEMDQSGDFIVPTLNGVPYYNKPPLYNWIIWMVSTAWGSFGEWPSRLTTLFFQGLFAVSVYVATVKIFDKITALTLALMLLTSGRILFWDSMLGLIDICFSFVVFLNFMALYFYGARKKWTLFFVVSYILFAVAFLLKGLPAIVFQGISIITALVLHKSFRSQFVSWRHIISIFIAAVILSAYYIPYAQAVEIDKVMYVLFDQSMQRTGTHHGTWKTLLHVFTFPFEQLYHFLPWSLLVLSFLHPKARTWICQHPFIRFNFWMLLANIIVYWISVEVYPRYLLMFVPLFNIIAFYIVQQVLNENSFMGKVIKGVFAGLAALILLVILLMPVDIRARTADAFWLTWILGVTLTVISLTGMIYDQKRFILWTGISLLIVRSVFNVVVLPDREITLRENFCRDDVRRVAALYEGTWYVYRNTETHQVARFYTSAYTEQIIHKVENADDKSAYYLVDQKLYPDFPGQVVDSLLLENRQYIKLMRPE